MVSGFGGCVFAVFYFGDLCVVGFDCVGFGGLGVMCYGVLVADVLGVLFVDLWAVRCGLLLCGHWFVCVSGWFLDLHSGSV